MKVTASFAFATRRDGFRFSIISAGIIDADIPKKTLEKQIAGHLLVQDEAKDYCLGSVLSVSMDIPDLPDQTKHLLSTTLKALVLSYEAAGKSLMARKGWSWYDAASEIAAQIPEDEWAIKFSQIQ